MRGITELYIMAVWIKINVGGRKFETQKDTVTKYPDSLLAKMILDEEETQRLRRHHGQDHVSVLSVDVDCDPDYFAVILSWLR